MIKNIERATFIAKVGLQRPYMQSISALQKKKKKKKETVDEAETFC